jgi:hypothetical protein
MIAGSDLVYGEGQTTRLWTHSDLYNYCIPDKMGTMISWIDLYFQNCHLYNPTLPQYVVDQHFYDLPLPLLHIMLACCWPFSSLHIDVFTEHIEISKATKHKVLEPPSLMGVLTELHYSSYYNWSGNTSGQIFSGTLAIRMAQMIRLGKMRVAPIVSVHTNCILDAEILRELECRTYLYSYILDFYGRAIYDLPCFIKQPVDSDMLTYFDLYGGKDSLYPYNSYVFLTSHLVISKLFIPLITIGRRYYDLLDDNINDKKSILNQLDLESILAELGHWRSLQHNLEPITTAPIMGLNMCSILDSYMLMTYHFLNLIVLTKSFVDKIEKADLHDSILIQAYHHATSMGELIREQLLNNPRFENMPILAGKCVFISGVYLCAFAHRMPEIARNVVEHIEALGAISEYSLKTYNSAYADQLNIFVLDPLAGIEFMRNYK